MIYESSNGLTNDCPNILFLTNQCNCCCEYCYENLQHKNTEPFFAKFEDLKDRLDVLAQNDFVNTMVVFGGEPTLNMEVIAQIIDYTTQKYEGQFVYYMDTNGILLANEDFLNKYIKYFKNTDILLCAFSYDGSANFRRKDKSGNETTEYVLKAIDNFEQRGIDYNISYVVNFFNYDICHKDFIQIMLKYKHLNRLVLSVNYQELSKKFNKFDKLNDILDETFKQKCLSIYNRFHIPICDITCKLCQQCDKKTGINYIMPEKTYYSKEGKMDNFEFF